jgi:hypothetical protein
MSDTNTTYPRTVRLSKIHSTYLANTQFLPEDLERIVSTAETSEDEVRVLRLDPDTAERFRDEFTTRLARVGFDTNYEPTREGKLLEDLIDRFAK